MKHQALFCLEDKIKKKVSSAASFVWLFRIKGQRISSPRSQLIPFRVRLVLVELYRSDRQRENHQGFLQQ